MDDHRRTTVGIARGIGEPWHGSPLSRAAIVAALEEAGGHRERAAEMLGMSRTTLWRRIKAYGIDEPA